MKKNNFRSKLLALKRTTFNRILFSCVVVLCTFPALSYSANSLPSPVDQSQQPASVITGKVIDTDGEPLIGASVIVKNSKLGTVTDLNGKFTVKATHGQELVVSYIGMDAKTVKVGNSTQLNVTLEANSKVLDEVVAVGYANMKRKDLTGSVSSIGSEAFGKSTPTSLDQVLQGRVAGLQMTQNSGIPGGGTSIQIRGINSINNSNEPIYVVDGVIISGSTGSNSSNAISGINTNDIESIDVLKDASATAIYGAQGANGVILITMKKGQSEKAKIGFNAYYGIQQLPNQVKMMNLREYAEHYNALQDALGFTSNRKNEFSNPSTLGIGTNWQDEVFGLAPTESLNLSIRGGNKTSNYSVSGGYFGQDGIGVGSSFKRTTFRVNAETQARDWLKVGALADISYTNQETSIASWSIIPYALYQSPEVQVYNADGTYGGPDTNFDSALAGYVNPLAIAQLTDRLNDKFGTRANTFLEIKPNKYINIRTEITANANIDNYRFFLPAYKIGAYTNATTDNIHQKTFALNLGWKNIINYDRTFAKLHHFTLMLGHEVSAYKSDQVYGERTGGSNVLTGLDAGDAATATNNGNSSENKFVSLFGRIFYSFDNKYQLTATVRRDGSSNFSAGKQWGTFPSAAVAWRASDEKFFAPLKSVFDNLKFRLSYGIVGNSNASSFAYQNRLSNVLSNSWGPTFQTSNIANPDLTWETTKSWNVGADISVLKNKISLVIDAYTKKTDNLLLRLALPAYFGTTSTGSASAPWYNIGSIQNKGIEFTLNTVNINTKNFNWSSSITYTLNRNKVLAMNSQSAFIDGINDGITVTRTAVGFPMSQFYGYQVIGRINSAADFLKDNGDGTSKVTVATVKYAQDDVINNTSSTLKSSTYIGDLIFKDVNGDGIINDKDKTYIGSPLPSFTFGFNNTFIYKDFDLTIFVYGSIGNKVLNQLRVKTDDPRQSYNLSKTAINYCKLEYIDGNSSNTNIWNIQVAPGSDASEVRMGATDPNTNNSISSRFVEDASFLSFQNIAFGYTLPKNFTSKLNIAKLRVYASVQNAYILTNYSGFDPQVGSTQGNYSSSGQSMLMYGVDTGRIPSPRIYTIGFDLNF